MSISAYPALTVLEAQTLQILASVPLPQCSHRIGIDHVNNRIYVTNKQKGSISIIDGETYTLLNTLKVGRWPNGIDVNSHTSLIYVTDEKRAMVSVLDGKSMTVVGTLSVGRSPELPSIVRATLCMSLIQKMIRFPSTVGNTQEVVNTLPVGSQPNYVAVDSGLDKAFVSNTQSNNVYVIDGGDFHLVVGMIPCK